MFLCRFTSYFLIFFYFFLIIIISADVFTMRVCYTLWSHFPWAHSPPIIFMLLLLCIPSNYVYNRQRRRRRAEVASYVSTCLAAHEEMDFYLANDQGGLLVSSVKNISVDEFDLVCTTDVMGGEIPNVREVIFLLDYSCRTTAWIDRAPRRPRERPTHQVKRGK